MFIVTSIILFIFWIVLSGRFDGFHLTLGVLSSLWVAFISHDLLFQKTEISLLTRCKQIYRFLWYLVWLAGQIFLSNVYVLRLVFLPKIEEALDPTLFKFKTSLKDEFSKFIFANSITLTPGTVTLRITGDEFLVHAISAKLAKSLPGDMEKRIARVFEE